MANVTKIMQLCRLCLVKEEVNVPIFEDAGDIKQILLKIKRCLPVKVDLQDNLPKKICEGCVYKLDLCYQFYNTASQSEKQLLSWLTATDDTSVDSKAKIQSEEIIISQTQIIKEEPITDHPNIDATNDFYPETNYQDTPETITTSELNLTDQDEPPSKKYKRAAAAVSAAVIAAAAAESEEEDDPMDHTITKTEDESEEEDENEDLDSTEAEPAFVDVSQEGNPDAQPGPSGIQKPGDSHQENTCQHCGKFFSSIYSLQRHLVLHDPFYEAKKFKCNECGYLVQTKYSFDRHMRLHSGETGKKFVCDICDKTVTSRTSLMNHKRCHSNERPFACPVCLKRFPRKSYMRIHARTHTNEKPYCCPVCSKRFTQKSTMNIHMRYHTGEMPYVCDICNFGFVSKKHLQRHSKIHDIKS